LEIGFTVKFPERGNAYNTRVFSLPFSGELGFIRAVNFLKNFHADFLKTSTLKRFTENSN